MSKFKIGDKAMFAESVVEIVEYENNDYYIKFSNGILFWVSTKDLSELPKEKPFKDIGQLYQNSNHPRVQLESTHKTVIDYKDKLFELVKAGFSSTLFRIDAGELNGNDLDNIIFSSKEILKQLNEHENK